jgi:hypothetical protein
VTIFCIQPFVQSSAQSGCTDPQAINYNSSATTNDGSCLYPAASVSPTVSLILDSLLVESSGLAIFNNHLFTHNDSGDTTLYELDTLNGAIVQTHLLTGIVNRDCEELQQDANFFYLADFGNNANGNRTDLHILRIEKSSLLVGTAVIDTISFSYANQIDFTATGGNNTDFDCEAFIVTNDSIYLFNKQWVSQKTALYALPKIPGTHIAQLNDTLNVQGLITGITYLPQQRLIAMTGYSTQIAPFIYLLYDFNGRNFFGGNKRKIDVSLPFHQTEAITTSNGLKYYVTNEKRVVAPIVNVAQQLHIFDLNIYLDSFLTAINEVPAIDVKNNYIVYPIPTNNFVSVKNSSGSSFAEYKIAGMSGQTILFGKLKNAGHGIDISILSPRIYILTVFDDAGERSFRVVKH